MLNLDALTQMIERREVDTVLVCAVDMQGRLVGKRVTGSFFLEEVLAEGINACDYLLTVDLDMHPVPGYSAASWDLGYGDFEIRPDISTLCLVPWLPATALVLGDSVDGSGELLPHAPRSILKRQIVRLAEAGYVAKIGSELEFYLFQDTYRTARSKRYHGLRTSGTAIQDYSILSTSRDETIVRTIRNTMNEMGIPVESSKGEWGPGQQEINLRFTHALQMADRHVVYKHAVKEIAHLHHGAVTFMAKWQEGSAGNSFHIHSSLWDASSDAPLAPDETGAHGMSQLFRSYLAGQLAIAPEMTLFLAPYVNSYKRYREASFAPTRISWGLDNRTAAFRVVGGGPSLRAECRIPGADANPYLTFAVTIAAGLHGIENKLELCEPARGNAYRDRGTPALPNTLGDALRLAERSEVLRQALGEGVIEHYLHAARWEELEFSRAVTDWERARYFERV